MMKLWKFLWYYLLGVAGIVALSTAPFLVRGEGLFDATLYLEETGRLIEQFLQPGSWTYQFRGEELNAFIFLWDPFLYSMTILFGALAIGFSLAALMAFLTVFLPNTFRTSIKRLLGFMEAIPDLMVAFLLQFLVVLIYKQTGVHLFPFVTLGENRLYAAPMAVLAILPMIALFRIIVLLIEEEMTKHYVFFAQSKGLRYKTLIITHIFRNITNSAFYHSKMIVWGSLSSLFVIEYMFNINGISNYILEDFRPIVIATVLIMVFTPFYIIYQGAELFTPPPAATGVAIKPTAIWGKSLKTGTWRTAVRKGLVEVGAYFKNKKFLLGFSVIFLILVISIGHSWIQEEDVRNFTLIYDEEGKLVSSKPHPPSEYLLLGTDWLGYSILDQLLAGAKFTILFGGLIAFLRVFLGFLLAIPYALFVPEAIKKGVERFVDGFHYLPLSIIALILLRPVLIGSTSGFEYTLTERLVFEVLVLTLLVFPLVMVLIGNEISLVMRQDFMTSAVVLGGSARHVMGRHIMPHLRSKLGIIFGQQFIQTLLIFIHLGLFQLFLGGTSVMYDASYRSPPHSVTFEWAGLVSNTREAFMTGHYWVVVPVFLAFILVIIAMQLIVEGIQEVQQQRVGIYLDRTSYWERFRFWRKDRGKKKNAEVAEVRRDQFERVKKISS